MITCSIISAAAFAKNTIDEQISGSTVLSEKCRGALLGEMYVDDADKCMKEDRGACKGSEYDIEACSNYFARCMQKQAVDSGQQLCTEPEFKEFAHILEIGGSAD